MNAASLLRDQLDARFFPDLRNWRLEAALTGTLEAYLHKGWTFVASLWKMRS
ncbi:MAG TPA: hypothetical protein VNZ22_03875 [Bacillota bacterium]|nr:hypothetical protein [Bacillota bacterium]